MPKQLYSPAFLAFCIFTTAGLLLYTQILHAPFILWDDVGLITNNPIAQGLTLANLQAAFTTFDPELYIPLTLLSFQINFAIGGLDPIIYHLTSLILHIANAFFIFAILRRLIKNNIAAFLGGLLFLTHPINVEAVAWIPGRKDILSGFFFLLTMFLMLQNDSNNLLRKSLRVQRKYLLAITTFASALLSKVTAATFPIVYFLKDLLWKEKRTYLSMIMLTPFLALSFIFGLIGIFGKQGHAASIESSQKILLAIKGTALLFSKILFPINLSPLYPEHSTLHITDPSILLSILFFLAIITAAWLLRKKAPMISLGLGTMLITVAPSAINVVRNGEVLLTSDRYAYLPMIGVAMIFAQLLRRFTHRKEITAIVLALLCIPAFLTFKQAAMWKDTKTLFERTIAMEPDALTAHVNLGMERLFANDPEAALQEFTRANEIQPLAQTFASLGTALHELGRDDEAVAAFQESLQRDPDNALAYAGLGDVSTAQGKPQEAKKFYQEALKRSPNYPEANANLGAILLQEGKIDAAEAALRKAIAAKSDFPEAEYNLAVLLITKNNFDEAKTILKRLIERHPEDQEATNLFQKIPR